MHTSHIHTLVTHTLHLHPPTGDATSDVRLLDAHHVVLATPQQWDMISRRWKQRKAVQAVGLFIADELQLLGGQQGPTLEVSCCCGFLGGPRGAGLCAHVWWFVGVVVSH